MSKKQLAYNRVVVLIDVTQKGGSILFQANKGWEPIHQKHSPLAADQLQEVPGLKITGDSAKLIATIKALKTLVKKLPQGKDAPYQLVIVQTSNNVSRWLQKPEARKAPTTQKLGEYADQLLQRFPNIQFEQRQKAKIASLIKTYTADNEAPAAAPSNPALATLSTASPS